MKSDKVGEKIGVIGNLVFDLGLWPVDGLPKPNKIVLASRARAAPGGQGACSALVMRIFDVEPVLVGLVGEDSLGDALLSSLESRGVSVEHVGRRGETSASAVFGSSSGEKRIIHSPGVNDELGPDSLDLGAFSDCEHCHIGGIGLMKKLVGSELARLVSELKKLGLGVSIDVAHPGREMEPGSGMELIEEALGLLGEEDCFHISLDGEAREYTGEQEWTAVRRVLRERTVARLLIKMGRLGLIVLEGKDAVFVKPIPVEEKNGTGAGDAASGAFQAELAISGGLKEAGELAAAAGAMVAECGKGALSLKSKHDVLDFMAKHGRVMV